MGYCQIVYCLLLGEGALRTIMPHLEDGEGDYLFPGLYERVSNLHCTGQLYEKLIALLLAGIPNTTVVKINRRVCSLPKTFVFHNQAT